MSDSRRAGLKASFRQLSDVYRHCRRSSAYRSRIYDIREQRRRRMLDTYDDLRRQVQYQKAVEFLANDLFGHNGLTERGPQLEKAADAAVRLLPEPLLETVVKAIEFTVLSMQLDLRLAQTMFERPVEAGEIIDQAMRAADNDRDYRRQVDLVREIGGEIEQVVHKPFVTTALRMCRGPARWMGLSDLQNYLEHGIEAFRDMKDPAHFFQIIEAREKAFLDQVFMYE